MTQLTLVVCVTAEADGCHEGVNDTADVRVLVLQLRRMAVTRA